VLAYVTHFPRLYLPLAGSHTTELAQNGIPRMIRPKRGEAVFVPDNAWDKPDWSGATHVLHISFWGQANRNQPGTAQRRLGDAGECHQDQHPWRLRWPTHSILGALMGFAADRSKGPLGRLLTESLLHSCLRLIKAVPAHHSRKAVRTYESICLYVQENFQSSLTRESVANHFGLAPNHVSRLFRREGSIGFNDYLNIVRLNRAKFMLRNYGMTLKEVAANCGYNDVTYFCRIFKRMNKGTPTEYRSAENS